MIIIYDYNLSSVSSSVHDFWIFSRRSGFLVVDPDVFKKKAIVGTLTKLLQKFSFKCGGVSEAFTVSSLT